MSSKLHLLYKVFASPKRLRTLLSFNDKGYLDEVGWFNAFDSRSPVDQNGSPIPWVTYSFIDFIKERLSKNHSVFEFGSGNSTYFYARHARKVVSVEHDKAWYDKIIHSKPENAEMIFCELVRDGEYCRTPAGLNEKFDIIIVDGRDRVNCCIQGINALSANGVIVLDDSERDFYKEGVNFLLDSGFKHLSFSGISPGLFYLKSTSVFYKTNNCLGI
ncbi:MAG TPA: FkbM family methyltransferase [Mucilaginibacter sp.]|jgi:hypothetical protein